MENPFRLGTIVDGEYFTDRVREVAYSKEFVNSANHLVLISPHRLGLVRDTLGQHYRC